MSLPFSHDDRIGLIHSAAVPDMLFLSSFETSEKVSSPFTYTIEAISQKKDIKASDVVGSQTTVEIALPDDQTRYFDGVVTSLSQIGIDGEDYRYKLVLRPWIWFAEKSENQRIFHNKSVVDIVTEVLGKWQSFANGFIEDRLAQTYPPLEYTVQYQETDLAFVSRLLEQHGISYHFTHDLGQHVMVLTDTTFEFDTAFKPSLPLIRVEGHNPDEEHFWNWNSERKLTTGAVRLSEFNFETPNTDMEVNFRAKATTAVPSIESYKYPGGYGDADAGKMQSKLNTRQAMSEGEVHHAEGPVMSLGAGMTFELTCEDDDLAAGVEYVCIEARQKLTGQSYQSGDGTGETELTGEFALVTKSAPFAPVCKTPAPRIYGPQTATVVGEGEIDCDAHGRILVRFPWDLENAQSMRCRVSQVSAHNGWGAVVLPRIGMEVIVEYLEGDPNKPVVTGCLYNGRNKPPIDLPANKSQSGFISQTHQGAGANEIRLEDQDGQQEFNMVAERDFSLTAKNDAMINVGYEKGSPGSYVMNVHQDRTESVSNGDYNLGVDTGSRDTYIKTNDTLKVDGARNLTVKKNRTDKVTSGNYSLRVETGTRTSYVKSDDTVKVDGSRNEKVKATLGSEASSITMLGTSDLKAESPEVEINGTTKTKIGSAAVEVDGTTVKVSGAQEISLSVGGSSIVINAVGVTIKGPLVKIN